MSLLSFIRDAGEKLFKKPDAAAASPAQATTASAAPAAPSAAPAAESVDVLNAKAGDAIQAYVEQQNLGIQSLDVKYDGASETATPRDGQVVAADVAAL